MTAMRPIRAACAAMNPFQQLSDTERKQQLSEYLSFLRQRDGEVNRASRTLSKREAFFDDLACRPVRWQGQVDREGFYANLDRKVPRTSDPRTLWLLAAAKVNRAERFGVELALERPGRVRDDVGEIQIRVELEEMIHTHILGDCCHVFGLDFEPRPPPFFLQTLIRAMVKLPERLSYPMVLCSEIVGVTAFQILYERAELFSEQPEVVERLRAFVNEILIDEMGHVVFNRAVMSPSALRMAERMFPATCRAFMRDGLEITRLAGGEAVYLERLNRFAKGERGELLPHGLAFAA
jgi:hypothetical protein